MTTNSEFSADLSNSLSLVRNDSNIASEYGSTGEGSHLDGQFLLDNSNRFPIEGEV